MIQLSTDDAPPVGVQAFDRSAFLDTSRRVWNANKVNTWERNGIDLVIGRREGYRVWDLDGRAFLDVHLNGGTYNLGHRNPRIVQALVNGAEQVDVGNHHFPAPLRTALAERLVNSVGPHMRSAVFTNSGSEAIDVAIKSARWATGRRTIVSLSNGYHGHSGLSVCTGDPTAAELFLSDHPHEFRTVPFNDLDAMAAALAADDVAAVVMETIPATGGFPTPDPGYLAEVARLSRAHDALYVADEVQTGLMRSGTLWAITQFGVEPDILVTAKGLGGGVLPLGAAILSDRAAGWQDEYGWGHVSTTGGSELSCRVALEVLDMLEDPALQRNAAAVGTRIARHLHELVADPRVPLAKVDRTGLVMGLGFEDPVGGVKAMRALFDHGLWAIYASFATDVLQFKPGLLLDDDECSQIIETLDTALRSL